MPETELIQALQNGEEKAFEQLVESYKDRLYNTVLSLVQNETDAEDITQEVFIKAWKNIRQFRGDAALATWLYRIAVTQSLDFLKRKKSRANRLDNWLRPPQIEDREPGFFHPGVAAEQKEMASLLFKAIRQLPQQQATAFVLQKTERLTQSEIAAILQTSESAVEALLQRAKVNLRRLLADYYQKHYK